MEEKRNAYRALVSKLEGTTPFRTCQPTPQDNIKWMLKKQSSSAWTGLISVRIGTSGGLL
jgi:hypothetical protein